MNIDNLRMNWKTTSAGALAIVGAAVRLTFMIVNKSVSEESVMSSATAFMVGLGLLFARDVNVTSADLGYQNVEAKKDAKQVVTPVND